MSKQKCQLQRGPLLLEFLKDCFIAEFPGRIPRQAVTFVYISQKGTVVAAVVGMGDSPEERVRKAIDGLVESAGWVIQDREEINVNAASGLGIREFPLKSGYGSADYLLYVDGVPVGVAEANKEGETLTGYEVQSEKYSVGLPDSLKPFRKPLPFIYQSTGIETRFTNLLEPDARSRTVFAFHKPETFVGGALQAAAESGVLAVMQRAQNGRS